MAGLDLPASPLKGISLLFVKLDDIVDNPTDYKQFPNGLDLIYAIEDVCGRGKIEGAQRIGKLFRIYVKCEKAKDQLTIEGFTFKGRHVSFHTRNPFTINEEPDTVKIIIGGVPLSVANSEFEKALIDLNVDIISDLKFENYRDRDGKWTAYKTGRRFVYCKKPKLNLKPFIKIGLWNGSLYYREQVRPKPRTINNEELGQHTDTQSTQIINNDVVSDSVENNSTDSNDIVSNVDNAGPKSSDKTNTAEPQPITCQTANLSVESDDVCLDSEATPSHSHTENNTHSETNTQGRSRHREVNTLSSYFDRRSRSHSAKRKSTVSSKIPPPPSKSAKKFTRQSNLQSDSIQLTPDWYENSESNKNKT